MTPAGALVRPAPSTLERYEPDLGLKTIALAETAEKLFQRAKDATRLLEAVELKLSEQRKFVLWWDGQARHGGDRKSTPWTDDVDIAGRDGLPDPDTIHRWRQRLKDDAAYESTLEQAQSRALRVCEFEKGQTAQRGASGTGEEEWFTPQPYIEAARDVLGAGDPSSCAGANSSHGLLYASRERPHERVAGSSVAQSALPTAGYVSLRHKTG